MRWSFRRARRAQRLVQQQHQDDMRAAASRARLLVTNLAADDAVIVWRWRAGAWERWSAVWHTYKPGPVPDTLPDQLRATGSEPAEGARFRFDGDRWHELSASEDERAVVSPDGRAGPGGEASRAGDAAPEPEPVSEPEPESESEPEERPSVEEMLAAWRARRQRP